MLLRSLLDCPLFDRPRFDRPLCGGPQFDGRPRSTHSTRLTRPCGASSRRLPAALALAAALPLALPVAAAPWVLQVQGAEGAPVARAVVAVELRGRPSPPAANATAQMSQRDRQFEPPLLVVQTGTSVSFPNFDTVRHHVYSFSATKRFELKLYAGTPAEPVVFDKPGIAQLGCNIHDKMTAHIVVVDTPVFGITDAKGEITLDLPPGEHRARLWQQEMGNDAPLRVALNVAAGAPGRLRLVMRP